MSKIAELQAAQKQYEDVMAKLEKPQPKKIFMAKQGSDKTTPCSFVQFDPCKNIVEMYICGNGCSHLSVNEGQLLLNALKELYE